MKSLFLLFLLSLSLFASDAFISPQTLQADLKNKNLVILDTTDLKTYKQGHIPNARLANISHFRHKVNNQYLLMNSPSEIQTALQNLGLNQDSQVVLYGHNQAKELLKASYIALALITNGFTNVSILDGGFAAWKKEFAHDSKAIATTTPKITKGDFVAKFNPNILVDLEYVKANIGKTAMIEAREKEFYDGSKQSSGVQRVGHISEAKSSFWKEKFASDEKVVSDKKLQKIFIKQNGLDRDKEVITYCTGGLEASMNWYLLTQELHFKDVKLYDASMKEWGNKKTTPMQKLIKIK